MELPLHKPCSRHSETTIQTSSTTDIFRVQPPGRPTCFFAGDRFHHPSAAWKRSRSDERTAIALQRSVFSVKPVDFAAFCRNWISSQHATRQFQSKGKHPKPSCSLKEEKLALSDSISGNSEKAVGRKKKPCIAQVHEENGHSDSSVLGSVKDTAKANRSKGFSSLPTERSNNFVSSSKISRTDLSSRGGSSKRVSSRETSGKSALSSDKLVSSKETSGKQVSPRAHSSKPIGNPVSSRKSRGSRVKSSGRPVSSRESSSRLVLSLENNSKELPSHKAVWSRKSSSKEVLSHKLVLSRNNSTSATLGARILSTDSSLVQKATHTTPLQSRNSMAEANGFRLSKRAKKNPEELQLILKLNLCSKHGDLHGALEVYDTAKQRGVLNLKQHHYNVLLYICSGAASGSITRRRSGKDEKSSDVAFHEANKQIGKESEGSMDRDSDADVICFSPEDMEFAAKRGTEIYEDMIQAKVPFNEATFTSVARLAVAKGDGDMAFETVKKMAAANIASKLRSYGPPLLCFCESNQVEKAFEVDDHMCAAGVFPDETLLEALLKLSIAAGLEDKVYSLLQRLRTTVRDLSPATIETIERWFNSEAAASAGKGEWNNPPSKEECRKAAEAGGGGWHGLGWLGKGEWKTKRTNISKTGLCLTCGEKLCTIDLDPEETEKFAKSVAELAFQREHNSYEFQAFQEWLDENGPFEAIIDGANIGLYNSQARGFNFTQVATVANAIKARSSTKKPPLIVLHCRRTSDGAPLSPRSQDIVSDWIENNALYSTPHGSNDDWYWLYAAVYCKCLLVTNDEMRDHLFELLGDDFFPKWKERHQVRFTFSTNGLELFMPPPYSTVIQESQNGCWHIPQTGGDDMEFPREWLCVTRSYMGRLHSELETALEREFVNSKLLNADPKKESGESDLVSTSGREASDCTVAPTSSTSFTRLQSTVQQAVSPMVSETFLKLEAAEKLADSSITFQI